MPVRTVVARKAGHVPGFFVGLLHHRLIRAPSSHREVVAKPDSFKESGRFYLSIRFLPLADIWTTLALATERSNGCELALRHLS
jgi:hypothetical protein